MWWEPFTFQEGQWYLWRLGGAEIGIRRNGKTWQSFCRGIRWQDRDALCAGPVQEDPVGDVSLQTYVLSRKTAALKPFFQEKPFLLDIGKTKFFPGLKITLELEIPPVLRLIAEKAENAGDTIFNFVPFALKETWFGKNSMEGIFCSLLPLNNAAPCGIAVHCNMTIHNIAKKILELDKIPFHAARLSVYEKEEKLVSDAPVIDALENDFHMIVETAGNEYGTKLAQGKKNNPEHIYKRIRIIKNIAGF